MRTIIEQGQSLCELTWLLCVRAHKRVRASVTAEAQFSYKGEMKEFGVYTLSREYLREYIPVVNKLAEMKGDTRPFVCVKVRGHNWLVPLSSLNPRQSNFDLRLNKQIDYNIDDTKNAPKAMDLFGDILHTEITGYRSVAQYYIAIPIKHKYARKYRDKEGKHVAVDVSVGKKMRGRLLNYLAAVKEGKLTGFIGKYVREGRSLYEGYPIDCIGLHRALYQNYLKQRKIQCQKRDQAQQRAEEKQRKKELRQIVRQQTAARTTAPPMSREQQIAALISICKQRITNEIDKDHAQEQRQAEQARQAEQVGQVRQAGAKSPGSKGKGKAPHSK